MCIRDRLNDSQESFTRNAPVNFSGCIIDPLTCDPVADAKVTSGVTIVTTDSVGKFQTIAETNLLSNTVTVEKDGHVPYKFSVDYSTFKGDIRIDLPSTQSCVWIGPSEGAWYKVMTHDGCITYIIDVFGGAVKSWTQICIGPGGNAYGARIDGFFSQPSINIDTPEEECVEFVKKVDVRVRVKDIVKVAGKSECLAAGSSAAVPGIEDLTDPQDIITVLFGPDNVATHDDGLLITKSSITGTIVPGVGIIGVDKETGECVVYPFLPDGDIGMPIPFPEDGDPIDFPGVPHQSVADGDG